MAISTKSYKGADDAEKADDKPKAEEKPVEKPAEKSEAKPAKKSSGDDAVLSGVTPSMQKELDELGVNPKLDNRTGDQRPKEVDFPAKPQQIDPEDDSPEEFGKKTGKPLGSHSEGPHGLGADDSVAKSHDH